MNAAELGLFLNEKHEMYNRPEFIPPDPISIPHRFSRKEDIEIAGFLAALIAWGKRELIIRSAQRLMERMGASPYDFVMEANEEKMDRLNGFVHRTFQAGDAKAILKGLRLIYTDHGGLEEVFTRPVLANDEATLPGIMHLRKLITATPGFPDRTHKHLANPAKGSSAKRINMFLRWMVRKDKRGVDFGLWKRFPASKLICPLDVHTGNVGRKLGLLKRKQNDWKAAVELTRNLAAFDPEDPVKYDFSLFGLGINEKF